MFREDYCRFGYAFPPVREEDVVSDEQRKSAPQTPQRETAAAARPSIQTADWEESPRPDGKLVPSDEAAFAMLRNMARDRATWCAAFPAPEPLWVGPPPPPSSPAPAAAPRGL